MTAASPQELEHQLLEILNEMTSDWDTEIPEPVTPTSPLVATLEMDSLDVVFLIQCIEERFHRRDLPFQAFFVDEGHYEHDFTIAELARFLHKHGTAAPG